MVTVGSLAQSVEHRTFNPLVVRSNRTRPIRYVIFFTHSGYKMDILALKSQYKSAVAQFHETRGFL